MKNKFQQRFLACCAQASSPQSPAAAAFAARRDQRRRQSVGAKVGQALVLARPHETFVQARPRRSTVGRQYQQETHPACRCLTACAQGCPAGCPEAAC
jgi:hypothetical protein